MSNRRLVQSLGLAGLLAFGAAGLAEAAPGDLHRVSAERANLRAGPADNSNVRGQIERGEQLIELTREGDWYGVRVMRTGEEGWVFGNLVEQVAQSTLTREAATTAGFLDLSESFDKALRGINSTLGYDVISKVRQSEADTLEVQANGDWLRATSRDAHLMTTLAVYQMWKNHENNRPVRVVLLDGEVPYVAIADEPSGPRVTMGTATRG
jgi:hypothetical protein